MTFAEAVRDARRRRGWSQLKLASEADTSQDRISDIERGADPSLDVTLRIAAALDFTIQFGPYSLKAIEYHCLAA